MSVSTLMESIEGQGAFFDVREEGLLTASGVAVPDKKVICRADNGNPLGIVSTKYKTVKTREIFSQVSDALDQSGLNTDGATGLVDFANDGARTMVRMRFPEHTIETGKGDPSILEIVAKNSYDGRWNFSIFGGACRMACTNSMLLGDWMASYSEYHNSKLDVAHAAQKLVTILDAFQGTQDEWMKMIQTPINELTAWRVICNYEGRTSDFRQGIKAQREALRPNKATKMFEQWQTKEMKEIGPNAFSILNVLTHDATHAEARDGKAAISHDLRMGRVQKVLGSRYWNEQVMKAA